MRRITPVSSESTVLAKPLDVESQSLLGVLGRVVDVIALCVQARQVGRVHARLLHRPKVKL